MEAKYNGKYARKITKILVTWSCCFGVHFLVRLVGCWSSTIRQLSPIQIRRIREAKCLSDGASENITAAKEACLLWETILHDPLGDGPVLPENIRALSQVLYGYCLVRIGQDEDAITEFDRAMKLEKFLNQEMREKLWLGKAYSLQRLMNYRQSSELFLAAGNSSEAVCGAATCALRLGNLSWALDIIQSHGQGQPDSSTIKAFGSILMWLLGKKGNSKLSHVRLLFPILGPWIHSLEQGEAQYPNDTSFLELAMVNSGPFDDPLLQYLDDKISLHRLLSGSCRFWPHGIVLPQETPRLEETPHDYWWMMKKPNSYGSHGNQIIQTPNVLQSMQNNPNNVLLQRLIEPTYPLSGKRKFSLRVYVVSFLPLPGTKKNDVPNLFLFREGLVKFAKAPTTSSSLNYAMESVRDSYMTNSGRDEDMKQENFSFLRACMESQNHSFDSLWDDITAAVRSVMQAYEQNVVNVQTDSSYRSSLARLAIPKILGFDFLVDANAKPWLIEVNRFPGLEPRDSVDVVVKRQVLKEAWSTSAERLQGPTLRSCLIPISLNAS